MCEKFPNQTNSNAALSECASDLLSSDIIHDLDVEEKSLNTALFFLWLEVGVQNIHEESPLPAELQTAPTSSIINEARVWGSSSPQRRFIWHSFASYIKCHKHSKISHIFCTIVLLFKGVLVVLELKKEAGVTDSQYEWKYRRRLNVSTSNNRIIKAARAGRFQHENVKANITPKLDGIYRAGCWHFMVLHKVEKQLWCKISQFPNTLNPKEKG